MLPARRAFSADGRFVMPVLSMVRPWSRTQMRSAFFTVDRRCAITAPCGRISTSSAPHVCFGLRIAGTGPLIEDAAQRGVDQQRRGHETHEIAECQIAGRSETEIGQECSRERRAMGQAPAAPGGLIPGCISLSWAPQITIAEFRSARPIQSDSTVRSATLRMRK